MRQIWLENDLGVHLPATNLQSHEQSFASALRGLRISGVFRQHQMVVFPDIYEIFRHL